MAVLRPRQAVLRPRKAVLGPRQAVRRARPVQQGRRAGPLGAQEARNVLSTRAKPEASCQNIE